MMIRTTQWLDQHEYIRTYMYRHSLGHTRVSKRKLGLGHLVIRQDMKSATEMNKSRVQTELSLPRQTFIFGHKDTFSRFIQLFGKVFILPLDFSFLHLAFKKVSGTVRMC